MNPNWLVAPIVIPMICAALGLTARRWRGRRTVYTQRVLSITAVTLNLIIGLVILAEIIGNDHRMVLQAGTWQAPFGITIVADGLSARMPGDEQIAELAELIRLAADLQTDDGDRGEPAEAPLEKQDPGR